MSLVTAPSGDGRRPRETAMCHRTCELSGSRGLLVTDDFDVVDRHLHAAVRAFREHAYQTPATRDCLAEESLARNTWNYCMRVFERCKHTENLSAKRFAWLLLLDCGPASIADYFRQACPCDKVVPWLNEARCDMSAMLSNNGVESDARKEQARVRHAEGKQRRKRTSRYSHEDELRKRKSGARSPVASDDADPKMPTRDVYGVRWTVETFVVKRNYASTVNLILRTQGAVLEKGQPVEELAERLTEELRTMLHAELREFIATNMATERDAHKQEARFSENSAVRFRDLEVMRLEVAEDAREKMRVTQVASKDIMSALCAPPNSGGKPKRGNALMHFGFAVVKLGQGTRGEDGTAGNGRSFYDLIQEANAAETV
eukprot:gene21277-25569_t